MTVAIVLGNWLNNDGSISKLLEKRLLMAKELYFNKEVDKLIVSGGLANKKAGISEADAMAKILIKDGVKEEDIIIENKSKTTNENALFSIPLAKQLGAKRIIVVSTIEHFTIYFYNVLKIFRAAIDKFYDEDIRLMVYTDGKNDVYGDPEWKI